MDKPVVALFDFDGTLTSRDTLPLFIRYVRGLDGLVSALCSAVPLMVPLLWDKLFKSDAAATAAKAKERLLCRCFQGKDCEAFAVNMQGFVPVIEQSLCRPVVERMMLHQARGHEVTIVSASLDAWVCPWAQSRGVSSVIATQPECEVRDGKPCYTGRFLTPNCNGEEKVVRIREAYPQEKYYIVAYGNSKGDFPMLRYADEAYLCRSGKIESFI